MTERIVALERCAGGGAHLRPGGRQLLLLFGLVRRTSRRLRAGILVLMFTPVARVVLVTVGLLRERDLLFGLLSAFVLAVLASSIWVAFRP